jgi:hypothetical protein
MTDRTAADPCLRRNAISSIITVCCGTALAPRNMLREAVPSQCARNETGAELLIEDSGE